MKTLISEFSLAASRMSTKASAGELFLTDVPATGNVRLPIIEENLTSVVTVGRLVKASN